MSARSTPVRRTRLAVAARAFAAAGLVALIATTPSAVAHAHIDFEGSVPADGDVVDEPVSTVTVAFTGEATPVGDEFVALTADGRLQAPATVTTDDQRVFVLAFDPPLAGGQIGVRWEVAAPDTHPIAGAFSFTVTAPAPTSPPTTASPATSPPATTATAAPTSEPPPTTVTVDAGDQRDDPSGSTAAATSVDEPPAIELDEFLAVDDSRPGESTAQVGRTVSFLAALVAIGFAAFSATAFRGSANELRSLLGAVAVLGAVLAVGALVEYIGVAATLDESFGAAWNTGGGAAAALRLAAGILLAVGAWSSRTSVVSPRSLSARTASPVGAGEAGRDELGSRARTSSSLGPGEPGRQRWTPGRTGWVVGLGALAVIVSFWFDGHTASRGPRVVHAAVNSVHVLAGAVWVGGVVALGWLAWRRRGGRRGLAGTFLRFSQIATVALVGVVVAGVVMAVFVLDSWGDLTGSEWGRTLLLKLAVVGAATLCGAYNHVVVRPLVESGRDPATVEVKVRRSVTIEAVALLLVVVVTSVLVAAAT